MNTPENTQTSPFTAIPDPREARKVVYPLENILTITICAVMAGAEGWEEIEYFGRCKQDVLGQFLDLSAGIPKHDVYRRLLCRIDPVVFKSAFVAWARSRVGERLVKHIAIDGKTLRHSGSASQDLKPLHMVSAWASEERLVLSQTTTAEKSNEITAIPLILEHLPLTGATVTIDAMGCQRTIAEQIRSKGGHYLFCLKGNQSSLHADLKSYYLDARERGFADMAHEAHTTREKNRNRHETRTLRRLTDCTWLSLRHPDWPDLRSVYIMERIRRIPAEDEPHREVHFYISSMDASAPLAEVMHTIRSHWHVENSLHWTLDVVFREDDCPINDRWGAENLATLRHLALSILKSDTTRKTSVKRKRKLVGWDDRALIDFMAQI